MKARQYVTPETLTFFQDDTGRATRIPLSISALGIFRVVKTTTLISAKQLIRSNLQVALQNAETLTFCFHVNLFLRFSWAKVRNHKKTR